MTRYARHTGKLDALAAAIDAAAMIEPYPRLAQFMERLAIQQAMHVPIANLRFRAGTDVWTIGLAA
jgi:hypothetical protein